MLHQHMPSANGCARQLVGVVQHTRDTKIAELDHVLLGEKDVLRLEIAVEDLAIVHVLDGQAYLHKHIQDLVLRKMDALAI